MRRLRLSKPLLLLALLLLVVVLVNLHSLLGSNSLSAGPSSPFSSSIPPTFPPQQDPPCPYLDTSPASTRTLPVSVPPPTYAPRSGRSITRCQGNVPEFTVSTYLEFALDCLTNTTFEHEHACMDSICDAILLYVPDNPGIIKKYARRMVVAEADARDREFTNMQKQRNTYQEEMERGQRKKGGVVTNAGEESGKTVVSMRIPSMSTPVWIRCSHYYLPPHLLTTMAREHARARLYRVLLWTLLTALITILMAGLIFSHPHTRKPVGFADEKIDVTTKLKYYLLQTRIYVPFGGGVMTRWSGVQGRLPLRWLDSQTWVRRRDITQEVWFKEFESTFKAKRRQQ